jgi:hypothetical protein
MSGAAFDARGVLEVGVSLRHFAALFPARSRMRPDGEAMRRFWALRPMSALGQRNEDRRMRTTHAIDEHALALLEAARCFQSAAEEPGCHVAAPAALASLEGTLQALSAAWYQLAADAAPEIAVRRRREPARGVSNAPRNGLSREREVQLIGALHDVAAGFARCARMCRQGRSVATLIIARSADRRRVAEHIA